MSRFLNVRLRNVTSLDYDSKQPSYFSTSMAVFEHRLNTAETRRFLASNEVQFEKSTQCILFVAGVTAEGRAFLNSEKVEDLTTIDLSEWVFTPRFVAPFGIYSTFVHGLGWEPLP